jgi:ElaB/YqjD/DUF883 family membrane-anchored ribosome-binding protein
MKTREEPALHRRIGETARNMGVVTDEYVHENAWRSIALAAVIGCVIGFLFGHRGEE